MRSIRAFFQKHKDSVWFSLLLNILWLCFLLLVMRPKFESSDDITLQGFLNRSKPIQSPFTEFANYIFAMVMAALYRVTVMVPWYSMFQYGALLVAFTAVTWVLINWLGGRKGLALSMILLVFYGKECYISLTFTKTCGVAAGAGCFLLLYFIFRKRSVKGTVIASLIMLMGSMFRLKMAVAEIAFFSPAVLFELLSLLEDGQGKRFPEKLKTFLKALVLPAVLFAVFWGIDAYEYRIHPEAEAYVTYSDLRSDILDHGIPSYEANKETFEALDINANAWDLYSHWNFYDPEKFTVENMRTIKGLTRRHSFSLAMIGDYVRIYFPQYLKSNAFLLLLAFLAATAVFGKRKRSTAWAVLFQFVIFMAFNLMLYYSSRVGVNRVDVGIWWACILSLIFMWEGSRLPDDRKFCIMLCLGSLIIAQDDWYDRYRANTEGERAGMVNYQNYSSMMSNDQDHLYITTSTCYMPTFAYGPFDRVPIGVSSNSVPLGGWAAASPAYLSVLEKYGVTNPYRDMIGNDSVRLITTRIDSVLEYMHDYYDPDCTAEVVGQFGKWNVYAIRTSSAVSSAAEETD